VAAGTARLRDELARAGRDPATLRVRVPLPLVPGDLAATLAGSRAAVDAGATDVSIPWGAIRDDQGLDLLASNWPAVMGG
jgi:hypothetical protein